MSINTPDDVRHNEYLNEVTSQHRQEDIDCIEFEQRYGDSDWAADLNEADAREALAVIWHALNGQLTGHSSTPQEALDDARDQAMPYIRDYAKNHADGITS